MNLVPWECIGQQLLTPKPVTATIGVFDGVHLGHQYLLKNLSELSGSKSLTLVVTFRENPKKILNPSYPGDLMTWGEKLFTLDAAGVDLVVVIDFSRRFSTISGRDFFNFLKKSFKFSQLVLGWDFSFGKNASTTAADLGWFADPMTRLSILPPYKVDGSVVSSTSVRQAVSEGDFVRVKTLLGRQYEIPVSLSESNTGWRHQIAREAFKKLLPCPGVYVVSLNGLEVELLVDENMVSWESPPGLHFQNIVFV